MAANNHPEKRKAAENIYISNSTHFRKKIKSRKHAILPESFVREHGKSLCNHSTVRLEVPTGDIWEVKLETSDDDGFWFKDGWEKFTSFYKVKKGYELDFRYKTGSNRFKVEIYTNPSREIRYLIRQQNSVSTPSVEELKDDASPVNKLSSLSGFRSSKSGEAEASVWTESFEVVMQRSSVDSPYTWWLPAKLVQECIKDEEESGKIKLIDISSNGKSKTWVVGFTRNKEGRVRGSTTDWREFVEYNSLVVGDVCILERIISGGNGDPLSFKITIRRATRKDQASTPNLLIDDDDDALMSIMSESDDYSSPSTPPLKRMRKSNGKASCSRLGKAQHRDMEGKAGVSQPADSAKNPFFEVVMVDRNCLYNKNIWTFVKKNLNSWQKEQILYFKTEAADRSWRVKLRTYPDRYDARLGTGVKDILRDNSVDVGDLCTFKLINRKENLFMVSISKGCHEEMKSKEDVKKKQIRTPIRPPSSSSTPIKELEDDEDDASHVNKSSSLSGPRSSKQALHSKIGTAEALVRTESFEVVMEQSSVHRPHTWWLPTELVQEYIKDEEEEGEIKLIDISSNGYSKTWVVRYTRSKERRTRVKGSSRDWRIFIEDNNLVVDDILVLELMRFGGKIGNPLSFNITIRRASHEGQASTPHLISTKAKMSNKVDKEKKEGIIELDLEEEQEETSDEETSDEETGDEEETSDEKTSDDKQQPAGSEFVSKYPSFQATIQESTFTRRILSVDREFAKDNINTELDEQTAILQSDGGRSWPVMLIIRCKQNKTFMYKLREFLKESSVKVGDVCTFELVDKMNLVFRVSVISRSDEAAN